MFDLAHSHAQWDDDMERRAEQDERDRLEDEAMPPAWVQIWLNELAEANGRADIFEDVQ